MLVGLTLRPVVNILPTSMSTDAHVSHFRHSYTKDKRDLVTRLRRIEGQARGIQRLVEDEAYCLDILQQVDAMTAAADQVALLVLEDHIDGCLTHAVESGQGQPYVDEVMAVVRRTMGRRGPRSTDRGA
jgi:CsoR family transcriptional regulator, copper-sensing transcriptional repressor